MSMSAPKNSWDPKRLWARYAPGGVSENQGLCVVTGDPSDGSVRYKERTYAVCCDACRDAFLADPEKFLAPWDLRRVVHLHRRAGFAATWSELQRDLKDGPQKSIDRLLKGQAREGVPDNFHTVAGRLARAVNPADLKAWWLYRMYWGPDPLGERLTLLWHNHFATSNDKLAVLTTMVRPLDEIPAVLAMRRQNEIFRERGRGPFGQLLKAVVHDPALLVWLDAPANRNGAPNENLGRELMELFTLGIGNYTETDVKEAARALTGWTVAGKTTTLRAFRDSPADHDDGDKTILGHKGRWKGDDLVRILLEHPATARRLASRLCDWLMGERVVPVAALDALAAGLRQHELDVGWAVETVLRSRAFFAEANLGKRVLGPVEYLIGVPRALECFDPPPSSLVLGEWTKRLGQDLFYPPNVGGWPGGRTWLTTQGIVGRANFAAALTEGRLWSHPVAMDGLALAKRHDRGRDLDDVLAFAAEVLTGAPPDAAWRKRLLAALGPGAKLGPGAARAGIALVAASPEVQMA
jgi:uncharacterized protein (DUF1800 family)